MSIAFETSLKHILILKSQKCTVVVITDIRSASTSAWFGFYPFFWIAGLPSVSYVFLRIFMETNDMSLSLQMQESYIRHLCFAEDLPGGGKLERARVHWCPGERPSLHCHCHGSGLQLEPSPHNSILPPLHLESYYRDLKSSFPSLDTVLWNAFLPCRSKVQIELETDCNKALKFAAFLSISHKPCRAAKFVILFWFVCGLDGWLQNGFAWVLSGLLVGTCNWHSFGDRKLSHF